MKVKKLSESYLIEDTLTSIKNNVSSLLPMCNLRFSSKDNWIIITTPNNIDYAIPVEELSSYNTNDYKKLRFTGNGTVTNGILTDNATGNQYRCYIGIPINHTHYDYDKDVKVYEIIRNNLNNPIKLNDFIVGINSGRF